MSTPRAYLKQRNRKRRIGHAWAKQMAFLRKIKEEVMGPVKEQRAEFAACDLPIDPISWRDL